MELARSFSEAVGLIPSSFTNSFLMPSCSARFEEAIRGTDCNFSQFIIEATRFALENLSEEAELLYYN